MSKGGTPTSKKDSQQVGYRSLATTIRRALVYLRKEAASHPRLAPLCEKIDAAVLTANDIVGQDSSETDKAANELDGSRISGKPE